jgi:hypothetical protein
MPAIGAAAASSTPAMAAESLLSDPAVPSMLQPTPAEKSRTMLFVGIGGVLLAAAAAFVLLSQKGGAHASPVSIQPPQTAQAEAPKVSAAAVAPLPAPAPIVIDSNAIAEAVTKRLALAEASKKGKSTVNTDSLKRLVQRELADSIAKINAKRASAAAAAAATTTAAPTNVAAAVPAAAPAPAPAPAPAAPLPGPTAPGKKRLAITSPRENANPALNAFTRSYIDALRASLGDNDEFDAIDQDVVRDVQSRTSSRDEAAKVLKPDVMVWPGYAGSGDTVNVVVTVWDMRSSSSFGIRVTSAKLVASNPDHYLAPLVQSVMKQLNDLNNMPTIYRKQ